jgi:hypothetical protein
VRSTGRSPGVPTSASVCRCSGGQCCGTRVPASGRRSSLGNRERRQVFKFKKGIQNNKKHHSFQKKRHSFQKKNEKRRKHV